MLLCVLQYARARSRVAKSLGLDMVVADTGRSRRERKSVKYDYDDFDIKMKVGSMPQGPGTARPGSQRLLSTCALCYGYHLGGGVWCPEPLHLSDHPITS